VRQQPRTSQDKEPTRGSAADRGVRPTVRPGSTCGGDGAGTNKPVSPQEGGFSRGSSGFSHVTVDINGSSLLASSRELSFARWVSFKSDVARSPAMSRRVVSIWVSSLPIDNGSRGFLSSFLRDLRLE
jgi:hypothetical protein